MAVIYGEIALNDETENVCKPNKRAMFLKGFASAYIEMISEGHTTLIKHEESSSNVEDEVKKQTRQDEAVCS